MIRPRFLLVLPALLVTAFPACAAKFRGIADPAHNRVALLSSSKTAEKCWGGVNFTYFDTAKGKRDNGWTDCGKFITKPGKDVEVCGFSDPRLVAPEIKGDPVVGCPWETRPVQ